MKLPVSRTSSPRRGSVLSWAVFGAMAVFTSAFILSTLASSSQRIAGSDFERTGARYLSEGALAHASEALAGALARGDAPAPRGSATIGDDEVHWTVSSVTGPPALGEHGVEASPRLYRLEGSGTRGGIRAVSRRVVRGRVSPGDPGTVTLEEVVSW